VAGQKLFANGIYHPGRTSYLFLHGTLTHRQSRFNEIPGDKGDKSERKFKQNGIFWRVRIVAFSPARRNESQTRI
jgi:hypothetical protein